MTQANSSQNTIAIGDWPLIGRVSELAALTGARQDERLHGTVLVGTAGVGKSRLAREALAAAEREGAHIEWVQATRSAAAVPLGALADLVPEFARSSDVVALMRRCGESLTERARGRPVVLGVDDAQLLDPASAALVLHLAMTAIAFVVVTVRSGEPCPDAIASLWKDGGATRIELHELDDDSVTALVEAVLGGPVDQAAAHWVIDASRGNALYVRELVRGAVESGALQRENGLWAMRERARASASLIDLVSDRLADLDAQEHHIVELLALGEPLAPAEIARLTSEASMLSAESKGLLVATHDGVRLSHPLYGEAVRGALPALKAHALRMQLVGVLDARSPFGPDEALRVARLRLDAGEALSGELTLEAAHAANRAGDPELGGQLAELALADQGGLAAAMVLAESQRLAGRPADAEATLATAENDARGDPRAARYAHQRLGLLFWELRRPDLVAALLGRMREWSEEPRWQRFIGRMRDGYGPSAEGLGDIATSDAIAVNQEVPEPVRRLAAVMHRVGQVVTGDGDSAARSAFANLPGPPFHDDADIAGLASLVFVALETGQRWDKLDSYLSGVIREAIRQHAREAAGVAAFGIARLHFVRGRYRDAARWLTEAELQLVRADPFNTMVAVRAQAVGVASFSGDFEGTMAAQDRLQSWIAKREPLAVQRPLVARAAGWAAQLRDPTVAGQQLLDDAERFAAEMPGLAPVLAYDALRLGGSGAVTLLAELAERCHSRIVDSFNRHARARAASDGVALMSVVEEMAGIGAIRFAVEAASEAASVFVAEGRDDSARRAAARARELHIPDQGASLPVIDGLDGTAVELTARQAQLIDLARQGLSNADIADRLVISVRTVEAHLYRGMQKLGINDRHDL